MNISPVRFNIRLRIKKKFTNKKKFLEKKQKNPLWKVFVYNTIKSSKFITKLHTATNYFDFVKFRSQ